MQSFSETYDDLDAAIDDVRQLLDDWLEASDEAPMSTWIRSDGDASSNRGQDAPPGPESREDPAPYDFGPPGSSPTGESDDMQGRPSVLRYVQVVLHEWIANMIQHAEFGDRSPCIEITVRADLRYVSCSVIDNSHGFDLADALTRQRNEARALPERGMGLRIISACTEQCAYRSLPDGRYRFEFSIPVDHDPWLSTLF